jgi:hypothetical protein
VFLLELIMLLRVSKLTSAARGPGQRSDYGAGVRDAVEKTVAPVGLPGTSRTIKTEGTRLLRTLSSFTVTAPGGRPGLEESTLRR